MSATSISEAIEKTSRILRCRSMYVLALVGCSACVSPGDPAPSWGPWSDPQPVTGINTAAAEGCPIEAPDRQALYFASNRAAPGAQGKLDIYRSRRTAAGGWGEPENLGAPVNSTEFDYCPTPLSNNELLFVSSRVTPEDCYPGDAPPPAPVGGPAAGDMYRSREEPGRGWTQPVHLGCYPRGPNTAGAEFSPSLVRTPEGTFLYFSSNGYPDSQGQDIYVSRVADDGSVGPGRRVQELSSPSDDRMPSVRSDGLEIVFSSNRAGATPFDQDIYVATRPNTSAPWSAPQRLPQATINTPGSETRASLSGDGSRLYFGRKRDIKDPGDVFVSTRTRR